MSIAFESTDELESLRKRLSKMSDDELVRFGKAARSLCREPRCPEVFKRQLEEAKTEWRRRHPKALIMCARRKPEEGGFPGLPR